MRSAIFADIHANALALRSVLADIAARGGVDSAQLVKLDRPVSGKCV